MRAHDDIEVIKQQKKRSVLGKRYASRLARKAPLENDLANVVFREES